jgi:DNA-binding PadR family transcriptional regulator
MALREVLLTVLAHRPMTGYEISRNFDQVLSWFWIASHQQIYRELAKLNTDGRVRFKTVRQSGKPDKKIYEITRTGRTELKRWLAEPTPPPRPQSDILVKLLASASIGPAILRPEIERLRAVTRDVRQMQARMEKECVPQIRTDYDRTIYLALRRGIQLVETQLEWLDEVEEFVKAGKPGR